MCGICGFVGKKDNKEIILRAMMKEMAHRGPDSNGTHVTDDVALGFCRLSIVDLEGGTQPMQNEDDQVTIVFNGEIYNYQELGEELKEKGHIFKTRADTESLLHGFEEYGADVLDHLRGMFAFSIWDEKEKSLFAARDFYGIKPFYYAVIDGCFVFASEIKCILKFPGYEKAVNEQALEQYLSFQYSPMAETLFKGIYRLLPSQCLTYKNDKIVIKQYYEATLQPQDEQDETKTIAKIKETLAESVKSHMTGDVEIGAFLSGGVDSSFIAAKFNGNKAFTVGFLDEDNHYSEVGRAKTFAKHCGLEHFTKIIKQDEYWEAIPKVMYHLDEPSGDAAAIALYFVAQEAAKHVKVVTSGEGADEFFGGYNIYLEPNALSKVQWLPMGIRRGIGKVAEKMPNIKGRNYLIRAGKTVEERFIGNANIFSDKDREKLLLRKSGAPTPRKFLQSQYDQMKKLDDVGKMQQIDIQNWLPGDILQKADRMSMAHSLELRVPILDKEVFAVARTLATKDKVRNGQTKYAFRRAIEDWVRVENSETKKLGFPVPIRLWIIDWKEVIGKTFTGSTAKEFFHIAELEKLLQEHCDGKSDHSRKIWTVYAFLVWHRVFFETDNKL